MILAETPFPVAQLRFTAYLESPLDWPPFPGTLLRGVFGASLRALSCMTGRRTCHGCPLVETCPYPLLFEPPPRDLHPVGIHRRQSGLPPPFALDCTDDALFPGRQIQFALDLFGEPAIGRLAFVVESWRRALARGLGRERVRGELLSVMQITADGPETLWEGDALAPAVIITRSLATAGEGLLLRTRSPWRLQAAGRLVQADDLTPRLLVAAIIRRARLVAMQCGEDAQAAVADWPVDGWLAAADTIAHQPRMVWQPLYRYSARQRQRMDLGGLVGEWRWRGVPAGVQALLALGMALRIGKEAGFGLGAGEVIAAAGGA